ncbi:MAG: FHA domain-containing protein [Lachnospiraceae bacterium]|nr:FHA domain-containing protein [Lachnospiraceae bacterium]
MQIEQLRNLGRQSMRIMGDEHEESNNDFRELMLLHNKIEGILKFEIVNENGRKIYAFDVSGLESLKTYCEHHKIGITELRGIFGKLLKSVYHGHEFMLNEDDYVVTPETVFTDGRSQTEVAYFSGYGIPLREQLKKLAEYLMDYVDYQDEDAVLLVYSFFMKTKDESCMIEDLVKLLDSDRQPGAEDKRAENSIPSISADEEFMLVQTTEEYQRTDPGHKRTVETDGVNLRPEKERNDYVPDGIREAAELVEHAAFREIVPDEPAEAPTMTDIIRSAPQRLIISSLLLPVAAILVVFALSRFGIMSNLKTGQPDVLKTFAAALIGLGIVAAVEKRMWSKFSTTVEERFRTAAENENEPTLLLCSDGSARFPFSLVSDEYPSICAGKFPFFIGKDPNVSDYVINKVGVSKYHMKIDRDGEQYLISDLSSTNGVYLNGVKLEAYRPTAVKRGDEVRIAAYTYYCN